MDAATPEEDAKIVVVACAGFCFGGYRGMDTCGKCEGCGSQLLIPTGARFANSKNGYDKALVALRSM